MALGFARGANYLEHQGLAEFVYRCSVAYGEGYLVMLKGASEIVWFALGLLLFGCFCLAVRPQHTHSRAGTPASTAACSSCSDGCWEPTRLFQQSSLKAAGILVAHPDLARKTQIQCHF